MIKCACVRQYTGNELLRNAFVTHLQVVITRVKSSN